ncbi:Flp pilus assembly protein CpaB [Vibrio sp. F74]|uniref:Flp pilus assembly protein CpaB n=1 Tax=Vibrio sp. F74 TaxID=700020 RepID=UPI0035F56603
MNFRILVPTALIFLGAGLYGLSGNLLDKGEKPKLEEVTEDIVMISVWKAKDSISAGQTVTRSELFIEQVPETEANQHGIDEPVDIEFVKGLVSAQDVVKGQWVTMENLLTPEQDGYIELTIADNKVPFALSVSNETVVGGVITYGSLVDVIALSSLNQNLANNETVQQYQSFTVSPILMAVKVIKVEKNEIRDRTEISLVLELSRKEVAKMVIAKKIAQLEVHKSIGKEQAEQLHADSGDVLPTYRAIKEFRAGEAIIK